MDGVGGAKKQVEKVVKLHQIIMQMVSNTEGHLKMFHGTENKEKGAPIALFRLHADYKAEFLARVNNMEHELQSIIMEEDHHMLFYVYEGIYTCRMHEASEHTMISRTQARNDMAKACGRMKPSQGNKRQAREVDTTNQMNNMMWPVLMNHEKEQDVQTSSQSWRRNSQKHK